MFVSVDHQEIPAIVIVKEEAVKTASIVSSDVVKNVPEVNEKIVMNVTAYTPTDNGRTGITASGVEAVPYVTAAGPKWMPFGTEVYIPPLRRWFTVQDRGGAIHGSHLDLCVSSIAQAFQWGRQYISVKIRFPVSTPQGIS